MNFAGTEQFECSHVELWQRLTDLNFVAGVIPDVERVDCIDASGFTCRVRPRFSFLTGSLELQFEVLEPVAPMRLKVRSRGKGIGSAVVVDAEICLTAGANGTELRWTGTIVSREGLLKPVSSALIQAAAQRVIDSFWQKFRAGLPSNGGQQMLGMANG
jgi:carbon monoxide dehydrogenase subunit G